MDHHTDHDYALLIILGQLLNHIHNDYIKGLLIILLAGGIFLYKTGLLHPLLEKLKEKKRELKLPKHKYQLGDIIQFGFLPQEELSNQHFEVTDVKTLLLGETFVSEFTLIDSDRNCIYLKIDRTHQPQHITISKKINRLTQIFDKFVQSYKRTHHISLSILERFTTQNPDLSSSIEWISSSLYQAAHDVKSTVLLEESQRNPEFAFYVFEDRKGKAAIELREYPSNIIETFISVHHPISAIQDY